MSDSNALRVAQQTALMCALMMCVQPLWSDELDNPPIPDKPRTDNPLNDGRVRDVPAQNNLRVALVDSGVNYLLPQINSRLARSDDGKLVGYDFWDLDERPFDSHPNALGSVQRHGTRTASILLNEAPFVDLVAYRYPRPDMQRMADLIAHADEQDVRIIGIPLGGNLKNQWEVFEKTAAAYPHILFVVSAGNNGRDIDRQAVYPASLSLANMLVVTSANDFGHVAEGVNWGRSSVDYMVPAEALMAMQFDGSKGRVAGSSYAVPRVVALAARYLRKYPSSSAMQLMSLIRQQFANGAAPRQLAQGYLYDPRYDESDSVSTLETYRFESHRQARHSAAAKSSALKVEEAAGHVVTVDSDAVLELPLQVLVLDDLWQKAEVLRLLGDAQGILRQCNIVFASGEVQRVQSPDYLRDLETGAARTLMDAVRLSGSNRKLTVVFARDTLMTTPFDAEAFGRGNTRQRYWLTDSVWLTLALEDRAIALAHELFHVLINSGQHSSVDGSLMLARTTGDNTRLTGEECKLARERALDLNLLKPVSVH